MKEPQRRVEMKHNKEGKSGLSKRQRAARKKPAAPEVLHPKIIPPVENNDANEELVADHELEILLDSFEADSVGAPTAPSGALEPSSHGDDPAATEELWRRLSNTAWLRAPETSTDDGNSSTVAHRP